MSGKVKQKNDIETTAITNDDNKMNLMKVLCLLAQLQLIVM